MKNKVLKIILFSIVFGSLTVFLIFSGEFYRAILYTIAPVVYSVGFYISIIMLIIFLISFIAFWFVVLKDKKIKTRIFMFLLPLTLLYVCTIINVYSFNGFGGSYANGGAVSPVASVFGGMSINVIVIVILSAIYLGIMFLAFSFFLRPIKKVETAVVGLARGNVENDIKINGGQELKTIEKGLIKIGNNLKQNKVMFDKLNTEYSKYLPNQFVRQLGKKSVLELSLGCNIQKEITSVFIDIKNSTKTSFTLSLSENFKFINRYLGIIGPIVRSYGGFIDKYLGDGVLAIFADPDVAMRASVDISKKIEEDSNKLGILGIDVKIGLHTGQVVMGVIGEKKRLSATVISESVNIASYLEKMNRKLGTQILFTKATLNKLSKSSKIDFRYMGTVQLTEGKLESISIFENLNIYDRKHLDQIKQARTYFESAIRSWESGGNKAKELMNKAIEIAPEDTVAKLYLNRISKNKS